MAICAGIVLHYFYLTSRSLLIPMLVHFLNNSLAVVGYKLPDPIGAKFQFVETTPERIPLGWFAASAVPVAPRQIPYHAGFAYFELDQTDSLWEQLQNSGGIALHVAGEFPGLAMELWAIRS